MQHSPVPSIILVDFDGTLCGFNYPGIGPIKPGAREALQRFRDLGYRVVISSCRTCRHFPEIFAADDGRMGTESDVHMQMVAWLDANHVPYDEVDDGTKGKPMASFYVDDKGVRFEDNWPEIARFIEARTDPAQIVSIADSTGVPNG